MEIEVKLVGRLKKYSQDKLSENNKVKIKDGLTVNDLIEYLEIPPEQSKLVLVNGRDVRKDYELSSGDKVVFYNMVAGG
ncbi:MAG: MoaD/ThiS family protein [Halarsenatibacteraceae bacterium]